MSTLLKALRIAQSYMPTVEEIRHDGYDNPKKLIAEIELVNAQLSRQERLVSVMDLRAKLHSIFYDECDGTPRSAKTEDWSLDLTPNKTVADPVGLLIDRLDRELSEPISDWMNECFDRVDVILDKLGK